MSDEEKILNKEVSTNDVVNSSDNVNDKTNPLSRYDSLSDIATDTGAIP